MRGLKTLSGWFRLERKSQRIDRLVREEIARLFNPCKLCPHAIEDHSHFDLAFVAIGSPADAAATEATRRRAWSELRRVHKTDMRADLKVWRVLKCPSGGMVLGIVRSYFEYSLRDELAEQYALSTEDMLGIQEIAQGAWKHL